MPTITRVRQLLPLVAAAHLLACRGDRQVLFDIRSELKAGMSRSVVAGIIERHRTPAVHQQADAGEGEEWLRITSDDSCILTIGFKAGVLATAELRDEDSASSPCRGAPPDLR